MDAVAVNPVDAAFARHLARNAAMDVQFAQGAWYCVGFEDFTGEMRYGELIRYDGDGCFSDDSGEPIDSLYDPLIQMYVAMDSADEYVRQS
jgi:hypothetical protein